MSISKPMYFPPQEFDLGDTRKCAAMVEIARHMYTQWKTQGRPKPGEFIWKPTSDFSWIADREARDNYLQWISDGLPIEFSKTVIWGKPLAKLPKKIMNFVTAFFRGIRRDEQAPYGFLARIADGKAFLVFRGTESAGDWIADVRATQKRYDLAGKYGKVHCGFYDIYQTMRLDLLKALDEMPGITRLYITGHSLGSTLSTLAVPDILQNRPALYSAKNTAHYNLASPRMGDHKFASAYNMSNVPTFRIVNTCDMVPENPPPVMKLPSIICRILSWLPWAQDKEYVHVGTPVDFTAEYGTVGENHNSIQSYGYGLAHPEQPQGPRNSVVEG